MKTRKLLQTLIILIAAVVAITGVADDISREQAEQGLKRALATFAIARTLNGVISVAQGTELAVEPGGVGVIMTPGQILDPVNDLIERFSSVMLFAASSLGLQLVLLEITSWIVITVLLVVALAVWLTAIWSEKAKNSPYVAVTLRLAVFLAFLRFAIPIVVISTNFLFNTFLSDKHDSATAELSVTAAEIEELNVRYDEAAQFQGKEPDNGMQEPPAAGDNDTDAAGLGSRWAIAAKSWYDGIKGSAVNLRGEETVLQEIRRHRHDIMLTLTLLIGFLWLFLELLKGAASRSIALVSRPPSASGQSVTTR